MSEATPKEINKPHHRFSLICPLCKKRYRRVAKIEPVFFVDAHTTHYGFCDNGHAKTQVMRFEDWKAWTATRNFQEHFNHTPPLSFLGFVLTLEKRVAQRASDIMRYVSATKMLRERRRT